MREYAAVHGLFVEFRNLPGAVNRLRGAPGADIIYYGKRLASRRAGPVTGGSWVMDQEGWRPLDTRLAVPAPLLDLPGEILAAGVDDSSCGIYWQESGGEEQVERIRGVLERWSEALSA